MLGAYDVLSPLGTGGFSAGRAAITPKALMSSTNNVDVDANRQRILILNRNEESNCTPS